MTRPGFRWAFGWVAVGLALGVLTPAPVAAQVVTPPVAPQADTALGIRGTFSLMASYGFDLDLFGEVLLPGVGETPTRILAISNAVPYPTVYFATPRRQLVTAGFGVFQANELIVRYSRTTNSAERADLGEVVTIDGRGRLFATFSQYSDTSIEGGLRHYFKAVGPSRKYVNLLYGQRSIKAISTTFDSGNNDGDIGTVRLYDAAKVPTAAIVFGITYEKAHFGIFVEAGARWTQRLVRQDDDLRPLGLELINNTSSRVFMPANIGIIFRM